jgi:hypothetical protein
MFANVLPFVDGMQRLGFVTGKEITPLYEHSYMISV